MALIDDNLEIEGLTTPFHVHTIRLLWIIYEIRH